MCLNGFDFMEYELAEMIEFEMLFGLEMKVFGELD